MQPLSIFIGYDPNEKQAYDVFEYTLHQHTKHPLHIQPIILDECRKAGLFWRQFDRTSGKIWDLISQAPCSTEFSITRFLTPHLSDTQWALFYDCDMLAREDISRLFAMADDRYAVMVTKHVHLVTDGSLKMDGQTQTAYSKKNWSSCMLFNTKHPANRGLTLDLINTVPGRMLHSFCWLKEEDIGELPLSWNHLVGYPAPINGDGLVYPAYDYDRVNVVHFTEGIPTMQGYEHCEFADEWRKALIELS